MKFLGRLKELSKLKKILLGVIIVGGVIFIGSKALNSQSSTVSDSTNQLVDNSYNESDDLEDEVIEDKDEDEEDEVVEDEYISEDELIDYSDGTIEQRVLLGSSMSAGKSRYGVGSGFLFDMNKNNGVLTLNVRAINNTYVVDQTANIIAFIKEYKDLVSDCTQIKYNAYAGEDDTTIKEKETLYKILSFTLGANEIEAILNYEINFTNVLDNASDVWQHPKLRD